MMQEDTNHQFYQQQSRRRLSMRLLYQTARAAAWLALLNAFAVIPVAIFGHVVAALVMALSSIVTSWLSEFGLRIALTRLDRLCIEEDRRRYRGGDR